MGMYTGLRVKVLLKDEVVDEIKQLLDNPSTHDWSDIVTNDWFRKRMYNVWAEEDRSSFIPFGSLSYMPWDDDDKNWQRSITKTEEGYVWAFQCSLKNYNNEIEKFFKMVLPNLIKKSYHIEYLYEEWNTSSFYEYIDGAIVKKVDGGDYEEVSEPVDEYGWYKPQTVIQFKRK